MMNEDKRYDQFPYIRGENIVKLVGGPLHNQYLNWEWYWGFRDIRLVAPPAKIQVMWMSDDFDASYPVKVEEIGYKIFEETFWVMAHGVIRLYGAYFTGFH